ncbi:unnamed protein product [Schistocephalus solidus]|uniref:COX assembly mitochondrial protein n=1 Tax=Schistocephalus solidus TaxID=70667 RepID=A0A183T1F2_SCHSO|nr:unnamed protein product [Schistocephalus solidus]
MRQQTPHRLAMAVYRGYKGGPVGYGDPDDKTIADTERSTIFSKFVQERLLFDLCAEQWSLWRRCIRQHKDSWIPSRKCKLEFAAVNDCQTKLALDPEQMKRFEEEYLERRSEFRRTGVGQRYMTKEKLKQMNEEE